MTELEDRIREFDFNYYLSYACCRECDTNNHYRNCENSGICRNKIISNFSIKKIIDSSSLFKDMIDKIYLRNVKSDVSFFEYALDRLFANFSKKRDLNEIFIANIGKRYYGEEILDIKIFSIDIIDILSIINNLNNTELINFVLENEYGYLLNELKNCYYTEDIIDINKVKISNPVYYNSLDSNIVYGYKDYKNFISIIDKNYRIIDGYHRFAAASQIRNDKEILVIVADKEFRDLKLWDRHEKQVDFKNDDNEIKW